ncbi:2-aminoethylphosphonate ABC transporter substrate-binding protein [Williamsia maris]|uniref:2-aminoethylphosphonate transport system substrate-binding protein n=1 Tax=Williamsia maris TaxID=72806 RepID=A0ABT1HGP0_9NOCA|nr:2-aminoethylphosphonate ABC transporter substrate-binding protein [Williamsia maris]MCP2177415.1 2-aminoethylphosphonate transport system substrate-binding protein [Williamsia maris]
MSVRSDRKRFRHSAVAICSTTAVLLTATACGGTGTATSGSDTVTVYSADGLGDWYKAEFAKFTEQTKISVNYVEAGSGEVVSRVQKEQSNPQADLMVTLPPFIQKADGAGLLAQSGVDTSAVAADNKDASGTYVSIVDNYLSFIRSPRATPAPTTFDDLLDPRFADKIQYSTPGQAGDGTAVLLLLQHLRGEQGGLDYLKRLQANNVGPSSSTGKLQPKVSNGEIMVANGDVQMNLTSIRDDKSAFEVFFPADANGTRTTVSLPYVAGVTKGAPHSENATKLLEFLLSSEVQKTVAPDALGVSVRTDTPADSGANSPAQAIAGVTVWRPDWNSVLTGLDGNVAAYQKATGS